MEHRYWYLFTIILSLLILHVSGICGYFNSFNTDPVFISSDSAFLLTLIVHFRNALLLLQAYKLTTGVNDYWHRVTNFTGKVPKNDSAFPLCRVMDSLWNRKVVFLLSSAMTVVHLPIYCTSSVACPLSRLSIASGKNMSFQVPDTLQSCYYY